MHRVIIAGGRDFKDYELLSRYVDSILSTIQDQITIVSGHAAGADTLGERYAREHDLKLEVYPADWKKYGKRAGFIRNGTMAAAGDRLIAFWDTVSAGTADMIGRAEEKGIPVHIQIYRN